ncbi:MAG TPA: hypothetical protein VJC07_03775 [Candidatus Nanoarchaeia archaeon]|nr:hypothetical protein [Candidatus Nanoarchaeia archaeon]
MSRMKILGKCMILVVMAILLTQLAYAIGIVPGRTTVDFVSELEKEVAFTLYNNEQKEMKVLLTIEGELAKYVTTEKLFIEFTKDEAAKDLTYKVKLPKKINKPGDHFAKIIATELPSEQATGNSMEASAAVVTQLLVKVPYSGKYAEARLDVNEATVGEVAQFIVPVYNGGDEKITSASMSVEITDLKNNVIATIKSKEISLESKETKELIATWKAEAEPGTYHATALISYDGKILTAEKNFAVGGLEVNIRYVDVKNFNLGGVAKFNIIAENLWNEMITGMYAQLIIIGEDGDVLADVRSTPVDVEPGHEAILNTFWDTDGIEAGSYDAKVILHYADKSTEKLMNTEVTIDEIRNNFIGTPTGQVVGVDETQLKQSSIFMIALFVLAIINISGFIYLKKRKKRKMEDNQKVS